MSNKKEHDKMVEITVEIQEFLQEQLLKVDNPLMLAGCFAAQVRNLYVVLCGYETTYKMYNYAYGTCPNAHKLSKQLLTLPIHLELKEEDIVRISKIINQYG